MPALSLSLDAVPHIPLIKSGDDLARIIKHAIDGSTLRLEDGDILVLAQKIVSKAENRIVALSSVTPGDLAIAIATEADKDPRLVELILQESNEIIRCKEGVIIVEHKSGIVMANAGIDHSNVSALERDELVTLLPVDSNKSAAGLREQLQQLTGKRLGVIINDSVGRAWRVGTTGLALGSSGVLAIKDLRGEQDLFGVVLRVSETADADALASAACLIMGEADDASPVVIIRGHPVSDVIGGTEKLIRPKSEDMFR
ncbi:MAG: coenzyme F420-0:L-glutamate ligase [Gammaproteobacteria bacterium]|nr:coenzyme F420-0:L-glutamate ligase [Gammaproteobacteria bacterium]